MREKKYANVLEKYEEERKKHLTIEEAEEENALEDEKRKKAEELLNEDKEEKLSMTRELKYKEIQEEIEENKKTAKQKKKEENDVENKIIGKNLQSNKGKKKKEESPKKEEEPKKEEKEEVKEKPVEEILDSIDTSDKEKQIPVIKEEIEEDEVKEEKPPKKKSSKKKDVTKEEDEVKIEQVSGKSDLDDLYLTTSFKPFIKRLKFTNVIKTIFICILCLGILALIGYFGIYPLVNKYLLNTPKKVFETTIDNAMTKLDNFKNNNVNTSFDISSYSTMYNFDIDTNIKELEDLSKENFGLEYGYDFKNNRAFYDLFLLKDEEKLGFNFVYEDNVTYSKFTTSDIYFKEVDNETLDLEDTRKTLEIFSLIYNNDYSYVVNKFGNLFKSFLDDKYLSKENDQIEIDGKNLNVTRNTFSIDKYLAMQLQKRFLEEVVNDEKIVNYIANISGKSINEVKNSIRRYDYNVDDDFTAAINIYMTKDNEFAGIDYEENGFRLIYYYQSEAEFDFYINLTTDESCLDGSLCNASNEVIFQLAGEKKNDLVELEIFYNKNKIGTMNVTEYNSNTLKLSYDFSVDGINFKGFLDIIKENDSTTTSLKVNVGDTYFNININKKVNYNQSIIKITDDDYADYNKKDYDKEMDKFSDRIEELELDKEFTAFTDLINSLFTTDDKEDTSKVEETDSTEINNEVTV